MTTLETFICLCPAAAASAAAAHPQRLRQVLPARAHEHHTAVHVSMWSRENSPRLHSALLRPQPTAGWPSCANRHSGGVAPLQRWLVPRLGQKWWMLRVAQQVSGAPGAGTSPLRLQVAAQDAAS